MEIGSLHDTGDTLLSSCDLSSNLGSDLWLVQVVLGRVSMRAVDHDGSEMPWVLLLHIRKSLLHVLRPVH
jgi:hypothetical protein